MPHAVSAATACVANGRLHVMGGEYSNKHQVLEMTEQNGLAWTVKADMPDARKDATSVVYEGNIWVMGGDVHGEDVNGEASASVVMYNADADAWNTGPSLPEPVMFPQATVDGGILLCESCQVLSMFLYKNAEWTKATCPQKFGSRPSHLMFVFLG